MAKIAQLREIIDVAVEPRRRRIATVYAVHGDRIDVRVGGSASLLRGLNVIGGVDGISIDDTVVIGEVGGRMYAESMQARSGSRAMLSGSGSGGSGGSMSPHAMSYHTDESSWHANLTGASLHIPKDHTHQSAGGQGGKIDHGLALDGLGDDDHTIYSLADGTRSFTGVVGGVTPTLAAHLSTKGYVDDEMTAHEAAGDPHPVYLTPTEHTAIGDASPHHAAVTAGAGIELAGQQVAVDLATTSGLEFLTGDLQIADGVAGAGLAISSKVLAVGAGNGIVVGADSVAVDLVSAWSGLEFSGGDLQVALGAAFTWTAAHEFQNTVTISAANELRFRDAALKVYSSVDGQLDIDADVEIEITVPVMTVSADLAVDTDTLFVDASEDSVYINASSPPAHRGAHTVQPANDSQKARVTNAHASQAVNVEEWRAGDSTLWMRISSTGDLESGSFTSGLVGWQVSQAGNAEFNNIVARGEFRASVFSVGEIHATGGTVLVAQNATSLYEQVTSA